MEEDAKMDDQGGDGDEEDEQLEEQDELEEDDPMVLDEAPAVSNLIPISSYFLNSFESPARVVPRRRFFWELREQISLPGDPKVKPRPPLPRRAKARLPLPRRAKARPLPPRRAKARQPLPRAKAIHPLL
jgi:hypothetical protein